MKRETLKKIIVIILTLAIFTALCACTVPEVQIQNEDGTQTVWGVLIEQAVNTTYRLIWAATLALSAWVLDKIGKSAKLKNLSIAINLVLEMTRQTAEELQQTIVGDLKATRPGGKLEPADVDALGLKLLEKVKKKVDLASQELIKAAGIDLDALITGECEAFLNRLKSYTIPATVPVAGSAEEQEQGEE